MRPEEPGSLPAKVLYRPVGLVGSVVGGIVAGQVFKQVWKRAAPGHPDDAPKALESEYRMRDGLVGRIACRAGDFCNRRARTGARA